MGVSGGAGTVHAHGRVEQQAGRDMTGSGWVKPEASSGAVPSKRGAISSRRAGDTILGGATLRWLCCSSGAAAADTCLGSGLRLNAA